MDETMEPETGRRVDPDAVRQRAYELSQEHPDATPEENWLAAEAELAVQSDSYYDAAEDAAEAEADALASAEMAAFGHP